MLDDVWHGQINGRGARIGAWQPFQQSHFFCWPGENAKKNPGSDCDSLYRKCLTLKPISKAHRHLQSLRLSYYCFTPVSSSLSLWISVNSIGTTWTLGPYSLEVMLCHINLSLVGDLSGQMHISMYSMTIYSFSNARCSVEGKVNYKHFCFLCLQTWVLNTIWCFFKILFYLMKL